MNGHLAIVWDQIRDKHRPFPAAAYVFVQAGLRQTVERLIKEEDLCESRHVSGQELCLGLREHAISKFGLLARTVLDSWNITRTDDFGTIVFDLVEAGLLRKTEEDRLDDFAGVYDFDEAFGRPFSNVA